MNTPIPSSTAILLAGAFGGVAPSLVRAAVYLLGHQGAMPQLTSSQYLGYGVAALIMFAVGAGVAIAATDPRTIRSAFALGMTLPSLFQVGGLQTDTTNHQAQATSALSLPFIASAVAQPAPGQVKSSLAPGSLITGRKLEISTPNTPSGDNVSAVFLDKDSKAIATVPAKRGFSAVDVPPAAAAVAFEKNNSQSDPRPLTKSPAAVETANVNVHESVGGAFMQAVGLSRDAKVSIEATVADAEKLKPGTKGWCYLGNRGPDGWRVRYVDFPGQGVPSVGETVVVNFPMSVRTDREGGTVVGVAHSAQRLRVEQIENARDLYWAAITVLE